MAELLVGFITSLDGYASAGWWGLEGPSTTLDEPLD